jgi:hypothetical protein
MSIYFRVFPKNGTANDSYDMAARHVIGKHGISHNFHGKVRAKGGGGYFGTNNTVKTGSFNRYLRKSFIKNGLF